MEIKSHALSIANPAPWAKFGAVAFAASPSIITFLLIDDQGNEVTSLTLQISVRSIVSAGVS